MFIRFAASTVPVMSEIEYCVPCGLLDNAIETQRSLLEEYGQDLDGVRLKPGHGGVFEVRLDDELIFDKEQREEGYDLETIRKTVHDRIQPTA